MGIIMAWQYSLKLVVNSFSEKEEHAVSSDLTQIHDMETSATFNSSKLSSKDRAECLASLTVLTYNSYIRIKGGGG